MKRRFTSRPAPALSAFAAVVGVLMLLFGVIFFSQAKELPGLAIAFLVVWVLALIGIIGYHVMNATRPSGVPTEIIEVDTESLGRKAAAKRLEELEDLRSRKLISDAEYETKRQEILKEV